MYMVPCIMSGRQADGQAGIGEDALDSGDGDSRGMFAIESDYDELLPCLMATRLRSENGTNFFL